MDAKKKINSFTNELIKGYGTLKVYKKNYYLFHEGDVAKKLYFIEKGLVKVSESTLEGQNITFFLRKDNELFGMSEIVLQKPRNRFAQCLTDSRVWEVDANMFHELISNNHELSFLFLQIASQRLLQMQKNVGMLMSKPVSWRLAWLLTQFTKANNDTVSNCVVSIPLTHEEISNIVGCSRQTISETFNKWHKKKLIYYSNKEILIYDISKILT